MSLMGTTKRQMSFHGAELKTIGNGKRDLPSSDADMSAANPLCSPNSRASSRAPKRIKRPQDLKTPTTCAAQGLKPSTSSKEHWRSATRIDRVPLADLGSTQGLGPSTPKKQRHQGHHTLRLDEAEEVPTENDQESSKLGSDEESFGGGDIFTSTDQQQLSPLRSKPPGHCYDETTTEF